jgi:predicted HTH transcriptional regulator
MRQNNTYIKEGFYPHITEFPMYKAKNIFSVVKQMAEQGIKNLSDACVENGNMLNFNFSDAFWVKIDSNVTNSATNNRLDIILEFIKNDNTITTEEIAEKMDVSKHTILKDIDILKTQNKIERNGNTKTGH